MIHATVPSNSKAGFVPESWFFTYIEAANMVECPGVVGDKHKPSTGELTNIFTPRSLAGKKNLGSDRRRVP